MVTNEVSDFDVKDAFFFYPQYKTDKKLAKQLFDAYFPYKKNKFEVIKEYVEMDILNSPDDALYSRIFQDFIRRVSNYEAFSKEVLFKDKDDLQEYANYLHDVANPSIRDLEKVVKMMYRPRF